jgi:peptide/nickel transport system ATP-binding protein
MAHCATTPPTLDDLGAGRAVRCLLYAGPASGTAPAGTRVAAAASPVTQRRPESPARQPENTPLLQVQNLRVRFPIRSGLMQRTTGWFDAVDGVSFDVAAGETLALVGESGCGKTTTGKAVVQLLRHLATIEGRAILHSNGQAEDLFDLQGEALRAARRRIQIVFQDPFSSLNPRLRVSDILDEGLAALQPDLDAAQRNTRIATLVDRVGLRADALARYPHEFSGGQRQRIAIARALAVQPQLIVCDEPTSALDVSVQAQILNLLRELQRELGVSYLFITHNMGVVEYIADRVAVMRSGRIEEQGPCSRVLQNPVSEYTRTLMQAVPRLVVAPDHVAAHQRVT